MTRPVNRMPLGAGVIFGVLLLVLPVAAASGAGQIDPTLTLDLWYRPAIRTDSPTQAEMDAYWMEKVHYCGEYLRDSLEEVCYTYYHGRLTPFRLRGGDPNRKYQSASHTIDTECCRKSCVRWRMKDFCDADSRVYETLNPVVHDALALAVRRDLDAYWTAEENFCGPTETILKIQDTCRAFYKGAKSPLQMPDYTPANKRVNAPSSRFVPGSTYWPTLERDQMTDINRACCNVTCSNWMVKSFCFWEPSETMRTAPTAQKSNAKMPSLKQMCTTENLTDCRYDAIICYTIRSWCSSLDKSIDLGGRK